MGEDSVPLAVGEATGYPGPRSAWRRLV